MATPRDYFLIYFLNRIIVAVFKFRQCIVNCIVKFFWVFLYWKVKLFSCVVGIRGVAKLFNLAGDQQRPQTFLPRHTFIWLNLVLSFFWKYPDGGTDLIGGSSGPPVRIATGDVMTPERIFRYFLKSGTLSATIC